jgi:transcriptional regulator with XRE-family HTH domain
MLKAAIGDRSLRAVGREAGLDHTTIAAVLEGDRWPDLITIARLEQALGARLWPEEELG